MSQVQDELPRFYRFVLEVKSEAFAEHAEGCEYRGKRGAAGIAIRARENVGLNSAPASMEKRRTRRRND